MPDRRVWPVSAEQMMRIEASYAEAEAELHRARGVCLTAVSEAMLESGHLVIAYSGPGHAAPTSTRTLRADFSAT